MNLYYLFSVLIDQLPIEFPPLSTDHIQLFSLFPCSDQISIQRVTKEHPKLSSSITHGYNDILRWPFYAILVDA
jgi:hypothetical protein